MKRTYQLIIGVLVISLAIVSGAWFSTGLFQDRSEFSSSGVMEKFKAISEFNSVEMYFNEIIDYNNAKFFQELKLPFTEKTFLFQVKAKVKSGIDLSLLVEEDIVVDGKSISIKLPKPKITSKEILSYKSYYEKDGLFNEVTTEDTLAALESFQDSLEEQALESGIIEKSMENTRQYVENLLFSMGFESVHVAFK